MLLMRLLFQFMYEEESIKASALKTMTDNNISKGLVRHADLLLPQAYAQMH